MRDANQHGALLCFEIPGKPLPCQRARFNPFGASRRPRDTDQNKRAKSDIGWIIRDAMIRANLSGPLQGAFGISLGFYLRQPKKSAKASTHTPSWATSRPDLDNLTKLVMDAANGIIWLDDAQVVVSEQFKAFTTGEPCTQVTVFRPEFPLNNPLDNPCSVSYTGITVARSDQGPEPKLKGRTGQ